MATPPADPSAAQSLLRAGHPHATDCAPRAAGSGSTLESSAYLAPVVLSSPSSRYRCSILTIARAALQIAPLVKAGSMWSFRPKRRHRAMTRPRLFSARTVQQLIALGEAERIGNMVFRVVRTSERDE